MITVEPLTVPPSTTSNTSILSMCSPSSAMLTKCAGMFSLLGVICRHSKFRSGIILPPGRPFKEYKPDGGEQSLSRRSGCLVPCRGDQERVSAINKLLASDGGLFSLSRPSRKYKPRGSQTVTNSSDQVVRSILEQSPVAPSANLTAPQA